MTYQARLTLCSAVLVLLASITPVTAQGETWTATAVPTGTWVDMAYGEGVFVAIATGTTPAVVRSEDGGVSWEQISGAPVRNWNGIAYGGGCFVAVGSSGTGDRAMYSTDAGATWNLGASAANIPWNAVAYSADRFVAVADTGGTTSVMTSDDCGATWTGRTAFLGVWEDVTFGDSLFVATANSGTANRIMTSPTGVTWTLRTAANTNSIESVIYGADDDTFVAVSAGVASNAVQTSSDGITWAQVDVPNDLNGWQEVQYGLGVFVVVASSGTNRVMTSPDGTAGTWTEHSAAEQNTWATVQFGSGRFVAIAQTGTNLGMYSGDWDYSPCTESPQSTCLSELAPITSFRDIRTTYTQVPTVWFREDGAGLTDQTGGRTHQATEDLASLFQFTPCDFGTPGTPVWSYTPEGHFGLGVTADERLVVSCLDVLQTTPTLTFRSGYYVYDNTTHSQVAAQTVFQGTTTETIPDQALRRIDTAYSNKVAYTQFGESATAIDTSTLQATMCDSPASGIVGTGADPISNRTASISTTGGLKVWPATRIAGSSCQPSVADSSITGTKTTIYGNRIIAGNAANVRAYTWSESTGFTLVATNTSLGLSDDHEANVRYSKDGDWLIHWTGTTMRVQNATGLGAVSGPHTLSGGTINGCDMDLLNNYVFCVTDNTVHRVAVYTDIPTVFGLDKNGTYTPPGNTTIGDPYTGTSSIFNPGDPASSDNIPSTFLGTDIAAAAGALDMTEGAFGYLIAILIISGIAAVFYTMMGPKMGALGGFAGLVMATGFGFLHIVWAVLFALIAIAVIVFVMRR